MNPIRLIVLGGTGDVYLICALARAFVQHHKRPAVIVCREKFAAITRLFPGVPVSHDEGLIHRAENDRTFQIEYDNRLDGPHDLFYTHPCFERSRVRVDHLTVKQDVSQADMYRMLLRLPADAPLDKPHLPPVGIRYPKRVILIPDAVSWPNTQGPFWTELSRALNASGWSVRENDEAWSLQDLLEHCRMAEWVIAPQCGVMSILVTGSFPCRKTLATPSVDNCRAPGFLALETFPYAYVTKFANDDYDVEEFKVSIENRGEIVDAIVNGANGLQIARHNPGALPALYVPISPGRAIDELAVLTVKRNRFPPRRRAAIERDYRRYLETCRKLRDIPGVEGLYQQLVIVHELAFNVLERVVPIAMKGTVDREVEMDFINGNVEAIELNRRRVDLRREVDATAGAAVSEVKSYYNPTDNP